MNDLETEKYKISLKSEGDKPVDRPSALQQFLQNSSVYPVSQIGCSKTCGYKVFWVLALCLGGVGLSYEIFSFFQLYFHFPVIMTLEAERMNSLPFPAITVCNLNRIKNYREDYDSDGVLRSDSGDHTEEDIFDIGASERKSLLVINPGYLDEKDAMEERQRIIDILSEYAKLNPEFREYNGHQLKDFILTCTFNNVRCNASNFTFFQSLQYGNCYTFVGAGKNALNMVTQRGTLELELDIEVHEYLPITQSVGARVVIHELHENPNPEDYGFHIKPGFETSVMLKKNYHHRLPAPYRDNCRDYLKGHSNQKICLRSCIQNLTFNRCSCVDPTFPSDDHVINCDLNDAKQILCMDQVLEKLEKRDCDCPLPCLSADFDTTLSYAIWPSAKYFESNINHRLLMKVSNMVDDEDYDEVVDAPHSTDPEEKLTPKSAQINSSSSTVKDEKNIYTRVPSLKVVRARYAKLKIFYKNVDVTSYVQKPMFQYSEFFGQVGGQMGLWLGISMVTIIEIMEGIFTLLTFLLNKVRSFFIAPNNI